MALAFDGSCRLMFSRQGHCSNPGNIIRLITLYFSYTTSFFLPSQAQAVRRACIEGSNLHAFSSFRAQANVPKICLTTLHVERHPEVWSIEVARLSDEPLPTRPLNFLAVSIPIYLLDLRTSRITSYVRGVLWTHTHRYHDAKCEQYPISCSTRDGVKGP